MKKHYLNLSMEVEEIQQEGNILSGSKVNGIDGNTNIGYGGGGHVEPMARELDDDFDFDGLAGQ